MRREYPSCTPAGDISALVMGPVSHCLMGSGYGFRSGALSGANAIMTAVDQAGDEVARYRIIGSKLGRAILRNAIEITISPGQELTDELVLAIAISAPWLSSYFIRAGEGG